MPVPVADTIYDYTHTWHSANDRVSYERAFLQGDFEDKQIAQALIVADPSTSNAEISRKMTVPLEKPVRGKSEQLTVEDVINQNYEKDPHINDMHTTDFSGSTSGYSGSSFPSLVMW